MTEFRKFQCFFLVLILVVGHFSLRSEYLDLEQWSPNCVSPKKITTIRFPLIHLSGYEIQKICEEMNWRCPTTDLNLKPKKTESLSSFFRNVVMEDQFQLLDLSTWLKIQLKFLKNSATFYNFFGSEGKQCNGTTSNAEMDVSNAEIWIKMIYAVLNWKRIQCSES